MVHRCKIARLLVWILVCSCAHMPIPCTDRDEGYADGGTSNDEYVDIDLVLLGADFPDDVDDGPVDDDPEHSHSSFGDYYLPAKRCSCDAASGLERALAARMTRNAAKLPLSSATLLKLNARPPRHSFGETYIVASVQEWRESLAVFLI